MSGGLLLEVILKTVQSGISRLVVSYGKVWKTDLGFRMLSEGRESCAACIVTGSM